MRIGVPKEVKNHEDRVAITGEVEATNAENLVVPRTPTWMISVRWLIDDGATVKKGDRVAEFETTTRGFTLVNASLAWRPWGRDRETAIVLSANNIFDVEARRHASFTKDFVPLAGRDIRLSAHLSF